MVESEEIERSVEALGRQGLTRDKPSERAERGLDLGEPGSVGEQEGSIEGVEGGERIEQSN